VTTPPSAVPRTPRWGVLSSAAAPVLLVGGWTVAARLQSGGFSSVSETISALAALDADHRWVMSAALLGVGACHLVTAAALRPAAPLGRVLIAVGGIGTVLVAVFPLPGGDGTSAVHHRVAALAFGTLAAWPAFGWRRRSAVPALRPPAGLAVAAALLAGVGWLILELSADSDRVGLAERVAAGSQSTWPLLAVLSARRTARRIV
jgi:hypothetical membrane protein